MHAVDDDDLLAAAGALAGHRFSVASTRYEIDELWEYRGELWFRASSDYDQLSMSILDGLDYGLLEESAVPARLRRGASDILLTGAGRRGR